MTCHYVCPAWLKSQAIVWHVSINPDSKKKGSHGSLTFQGRFFFPPHGCLVCHVLSEDLSIVLTATSLLEELLVISLERIASFRDEYLHNKHEPTTRILLNKQKSYQNKPYRISPLIETICCNLLQKRDEPSDNIPVSNALVTCFACLAQRTCSRTDPQHLFTRHCHVIRSWCNTVQLWYLHLHDCEFFFFSNLREPGYKIFPVFVKENKIKYSSVPIHLNFIHGNSVL